MTQLISSSDHSASLFRYASRDTGSKIRAAADAAKNFTFSDETGGEELYDNPAELLERSGFSADSRGGLGEDEIDDLDDP